MKEQVRATLIPLSQIQPNEGQLPGLPKNPREIHDPKYEKLKADIKAYPELLELRGLMVYPLSDGNYITIGGNMRLRALNELGYTEAPCIVIPADTPVERLKAYVILDNGDFGRWDWDALANEWDEEELIDWGVTPNWLSDSLFQDEMGGGKNDSNLDSYEEPEKDYLECPHCHHIDSKTHFKKVVGSISEIPSEEIIDVDLGPE